MATEINSGKYKLVDCCDDKPYLHAVDYGTKVIYSGHLYIKLNKKPSKLGAGISISYPDRHCILFNPIYGTIRAVAANERVTVVEFCESPQEVYIVPQSKLNKHLK